MVLEWNDKFAVLCAVAAACGIAAFALLARFQTPLALAPSQLNGDYAGRFVSVSGVAKGFSSENGGARFLVCADSCALVRVRSAAGQAVPSGVRVSVKGIVRTYRDGLAYVEPLGAGAISFQ